MGRKKIVQKMLDELKNPHTKALRVFKIGIREASEITEITILSHSLSMNRERVLNCYVNDHINAVFTDWIYFREIDPNFDFVLENDTILGKP